MAYGDLRRGFPIQLSKVQTILVIIHEINFLENYVFCVGGDTMYVMVLYPWCRAQNPNDLNPEQKNPVC